MAFLILSGFLAFNSSAFAEVRDAHIGHAVWYDYGSTSNLLITGETAERAYNDERALFVDENADQIHKRFGPLLCAYNKTNNDISTWEWIRLFFNNWGPIDFRYVCHVSPMP